ncbi:hypothetical protein PanWU01x14_089380, partial [Parasponia andersonii]
TPHIPPLSSRMNEWLTLPKGWVKLNFDVPMGSNMMMLSSVARDQNGLVLFAITS